MFRRRVFYDAVTGAVLRCAMAEGCLAGGDTAEREAAALGLSGCACMEWMEPDAAVEAAFAPVDAAGNARTEQGRRPDQPAGLSRGTVSIGRFASAETGRNKHDALRDGGKR